MRLYPLNGEVLYHGSELVIVPRFTSFVEDFGALLLSYQVTNFLLAE